MKHTVAISNRSVRSAAVVFASVICVSAISACGDKVTKTVAAPAVANAQSVVPGNAVIAADTAERTLAMAGGARAYQVTDDAALAGRITGDVTSSAPLPADTIVTPTDSPGCRPFRDNTFRDPRGGSRSTEPAVGNAVVWLVGVTHGPADSSPKRLGVRLQKCQIEPRVQRAATGATLNASTYDDYVTTLRLNSVAAVPTVRAEINFNDHGQVVPSSKALALPGLLEIRDVRRAWIRGFIAVAPHPFVAVTEADGRFAFDGVPAGAYTLVAWHERLGAQVMPVTVEAGGTRAVKVVMSARGRR